MHQELDAQPTAVGFDESASDASPPAPPALETGLPELQETRALIDQTDRELVELLARRAALARRALAAKARAGQPVPDPSREEAMLAACRAQASALGLEPDGVESVFRAILRFSRRAQHEPR